MIYEIGFALKKNRIDILHDLDSMIIYANDNNISSNLCIKYFLQIPVCKFNFELLDYILLNYNLLLIYIDMVTNIGKNSVYFSLLVQVVAGIIQLYALIMVIPKKYNIVLDTLKLETIVQFVEAIFILG